MANPCRKQWPVRERFLEGSIEKNSRGSSREQTPRQRRLPGWFFAEAEEGSGKRSMRTVGGGGDGTDGHAGTGARGDAKLDRRGCCS